MIPAVSCTPIELVEAEETSVPIVPLYPVIKEAGEGLSTFWITITMVATYTLLPARLVKAPVYLIVLPVGVQVYPVTLTESIVTERQFAVVNDAILV